MSGARLDPFAPRAVSLAARETVARGADDAAFAARAEAAARAGAGVVLMSGGAHDCSSASYAAWDPFLLLRTRGRRAEWRVGGARGVTRDDPLAVLDAALAAMRPDFDRGDTAFAGGAAGYLAYDLATSIERLPRRPRAGPRLPDIVMMWPRRLLVHDRAAGTIEHLRFAYEGDGEVTPREAGRDVPGGGPARPLVTGLASDFTAPGYRAAVEKVRDYIARGDVYQVNLSQMFRGRFDGDPWLLWQALFRRNPAPFYAYVEAGDHQVASTSMERFLALRDGVLEARPIKGTRPRGRTAAEDEALAAELRASPKDDAELSMIVDLLRNDLGRVCATGSVAVREHKRLESYANVHHLVSVVQGRLRPGATVGDILRAAFPCGSITGCPKIRAMEVIDELEPHRRHVYTGSIGYLGWHGTLDLNVAIRTAEVHRGRCSFAVGGGIVYDSHPADEFEETLDKGRTFFAVAGEEGA